MSLTDVIAAGLLDLFGRQVIGGADDLARARVVVGVLDEAGQSQVGHLGDPVGSDQDIARLDVAVDQAALVGVFQPQGRLDDHLGRLLHGQRALPPHQLPQVGAGHVLGDQVMDVAVVAGIVGADQVGMIQQGLGADLAGEALDRLRRRFLARQDLDGALAAHHLVDALKTWPMPPWPIQSVIVYGPRFSFVRPARNWSA